MRRSTIIGMLLLAGMIGIALFQSLGKRAETWFGIGLMATGFAIERLFFARLD